MEKTMINFNDCTLQMLFKNFGIKRAWEFESLENWLRLSKNQDLADYQRIFCNELRQLLDINVSAWKEQDISLHFIGPMFSLINFTDPYRFNLFAQRFIAATIETTNGNLMELQGKPDEILASGYGEPETPFFAFNARFAARFKKEVEFKGDPAGQALAAMLVGQHLNSSPQPIYGCYVLGRDWYFMALQEKYYSISRGFDGTTDDVFEIFRILKALKEIVKERIA